MRTTMRRLASIWLKPSRHGIFTHAINAGVAGAAGLSRLRIMTPARRAAMRAQHTADRPYRLSLAMHWQHPRGESRRQIHIATRAVFLPVESKSLSQLAN
jgi:hypothetical protein